MFNPYVVVPFLTWAIAQFLKFCFAALRGRIDYKYLYASGGMPSVHAAVVTSLATTAFLIDGPSSPIFGVSVVVAGIVMYDSFGVRRASGEQAAAINVILDSLTQDRIRLSHPQTRLRELLGHKPLEVTVGAILGLTLGCLFNLERLGSILDLLTKPLPQFLVFTLTAGAGFLVVGGLILRQYYLRKYRRVELVRAVIKRSYWIASALGFVGLIIAFLASQKIGPALWIVWPMLLALAFLIVLAAKISIYKEEIKAALAQHRTTTEKEKWFEGPNRKRRKRRS